MRTAYTVLMLVCSCATYREDLNRGQQSYEQDQYDQALAMWRSLEHDMDALDEPDQARYAYLRGMTDYRLGFRPDSRHWLGLASAIDEKHPGGLAEEWRQRLKEALADLNAEAWGTAASSSPAATPRPKALASAENASEP